MTLQNLLKAFNRKERNWLVRDSLGDASCCLDKNFLDRIEPVVRRLHADFAFDGDPYWAIDFHFDWLVGALHRLEHPDEGENKPQPNHPGLVNGTQEDIDLVIATGNTLLLIEAKGEGAWSNSQLASKIARLWAMSPGIVDAEGWAGQVRLVFLLCSPRDTPPRVSAAGWPKWAQHEGRPLHFELKRPAQRFLAVSRSEGLGTEDRRWVIKEIGYSGRTARR